ncbi:hypothetical protein FKB34_04315 [Glycocaulis profundi]|nr:hypothetical protein FKB34_04315 [Glycocaulis profundi]
MSKRIVLLINSTAGTVQRQGGDALVARLREAASWADLDVRDTGDDPAEAARQACADGPDVIAVAGGDGTARCAAQAAHDTECPSALIPLPLGTANLLPKRLYGERTPEQILAEAKDYREVALHAGLINGEVFFIAATAGFPSRLAEAREAARPGGKGGRKLKAAWTKARAALSIAFQPRLRVHVDGSDATFARASAAMIVPGGVEDAFGVSHPHAGPARLETYAFYPRNIGDAASITMMALAQRWREHPRVKQAWADSVGLTGRRSIPIMLDGEPESLKPPVRISLAPEAVRFLAPTE